MIHYITGGERSGKSRYAERLAEEMSDTPYYLATSRVLDDNFAKRVQRHVKDRVESSRQWTTIEADLNLAEALQRYFNQHKSDLKQYNQLLTIVIDCVTLWLTNYVMDYDYDVDQCLTLARQDIDSLVNFANQNKATLFIISNEIGLCLHASTAEGRQFVSLQGWVNQYLAQVADKATLVVSGLPLTLK
ncbi:bifunctional adenosylcobinamide kinase/adenosylcobinamide-phosphate guanylyltransferase [Psychrobacter lutiphocae]|uniref:bifunctional adenosylcobinamide kinase/adenosylcobinamide-phosphate guanylyltransferase n=1 Tax=Psychrobacter lutiphocae TaxID=540500 RepID=UPI00036F4AF0|nr:bifunctional adenosylcobinamide kinase/adenosylcobinamide-phosphate guanylyltransferase [Psychrobacter lutiphocae]